MSWENVVKRFLLRERVGNVSMSLASKVIWRDVVMTRHPMPLDRIDAHLALLSRTKAGDEFIAFLTDVKILSDGSRDLGALLHHCEGPDESRSQYSLWMMAAMKAPTNEVAALVAIMLARRDLLWMIGFLGRKTMDLEEAQAEVVAVAWELVTRRIGQERRPATDSYVFAHYVLGEVRRRAGLRRGSLDLVPLRDDLDVAAPQIDRTERWPGLLAAGVAHGVLTPRQLVIIGQTRMDGRSLQDVAKSLGRPYDAVRKERQRAERALRAFALTYLLDESE